MSKMSLKNSVSLSNVLAELRKKTAVEHINLQEIKAKYSDVTSITKNIVDVLQNQFPTPIENVIKDPKFKKGKLWSCDLTLFCPNKICFTGIGVSKKTAEYNSKLTAILWLHEIHQFNSDAVEEISVNENDQLVDESLFKLDCAKLNSLCLNKRQPNSTLSSDNNCPFKVDSTFFQNVVLRTVRYNRSKGNLVNLKSDLIEKKDQEVLDEIKNTTKPRRNATFQKKATFSVGQRLLAIRKLQAKSLEQPKNLGSLHSIPRSLELAANLEHARTFSTLTSGVPDAQEPNNVTTTISEITDPVRPPLRHIKAHRDANSAVHEVTKIHLNDNQEVESLHKKFPQPKNTINNYFNIISEDLKNKSLKPTIKYTPEKTRKGGISTWMCSYHIKWPEEVIFTAKGSTKKAVSTLASLKVISWLKEKNVITEEGSPAFHSTEELKSVKKRSGYTLSLEDEVVTTMQDVRNIYQEHLDPYVSRYMLQADRNNNLKDGPQIITQEPNDIDFTVHRQRYLGLNAYLSKELIDLPIAKYKETFMQLLKSSNIIIVKGEPGCGKSTRIPQYVLESWALEADNGNNETCRIAVTQPRRIAAISLAERVASERNESVGHIVGYQVRLNSRFHSNTGRILYCTTGILLRHMQSDPQLNKFSHIILDEAHERDVNTDLLMNLLKGTVQENPNLKLIVMSATIDTDMFQKYFEGAPILEVPGFTYPVKQHFLDSFTELDLSKTLKMCNSECPVVVHDDVVKVINYICDRKKEGAILVFLPGWEDIKKIRNLLPRNSTEIAVYCLHSRLQDEEQFRIFSKPPPGIRKIILATNIAETSVTIDDVVYVVETGIHKDKRFDVGKGVNCIDNHWISKSSMKQRVGRAGRVQPGESFLLYPKNKYDTFPEYSLPEIMSSSLTKIVLDSKVFSNDMDALEFMKKLPSCPEENAVLRAVDELKDLQLLDDNQKLTPLGKTLAEFQLEPKLAKAMVNAVIFKCVTPIVDIVTLFSSEIELFTSSLLDKETVKKAKAKFSTSSDHLAMMRLFEKFSELADNKNSYTLERFCNEMNLVPYKMRIIEKLKNIHFGYLYNGLHDVMPISDDFSDCDELVKAVLYSGVGTVLQHRKWDIVKNRLKTNTNVLVTRNNHKATITPESVNYKRHRFPSNFLMYINETRSNIRRTTLVRECSLIPPISVLLFTSRNLSIDPIDLEQFSSDLKSDDQVRLSIQGTNISFICDKRQAEEVLFCKRAIMSCYQYYIKELTQTGNHSAEFNQHWDRILQRLSKILTKFQFFLFEHAKLWVQKDETSRVIESLYCEHELKSGTHGMFFDLVY